MLVNEYETTLVLRPDLAGDAIESVLDRVRDSIKKMGGTLLEINHWGRKKLAYPIEKQSRGIYIHTHFLGRDNLVAELERNLRIVDTVIRYLTVRLNESVVAGDHEVLDYVAPSYDEVAADDETDAAPAKAGGEEVVAKTGEVPATEAMADEASAVEPTAAVEEVKEQVEANHE